MKKGKNKLINLLKIGVLLFATSLSLWNCQNEDILILSSKTQEINKLKSWFNKNHNQELEKNNYYIGDLDWENYKINDEKFYIPFIGKQLFHIIDKKNKKLRNTKLNPYLLIIKEKNKFKENLIVFIDENNKKEYFNNEIFEYPYMSFNNQNKFIQSSFIKSKNYKNETLSKGSDCVEWGMYLETTYPDGSVEYELMYTYDVCNEETSEEEFYGGGGGGNGNSSSNNIVVDVPPDCASFNYSRVGTTNWQTSGVSGIRELFTVFGWECNGFDFGYLPQAIYFQLPINSNFPLGNGHTETESAVALHEAFKAFDNWYKSNACSASYAVMTDKFFQTIKDEFEDIGGNATYTPPLGYSGGTSPYQSTWTGYGNCY